MRSSGGGGGTARALTVRDDELRFDPCSVLVLLLAGEKALCLCPDIMRSFPTVVCCQIVEVGTKLKVNGFDLG